MQLEPYFSRIRFTPQQKKTWFHDREGVLRIGDGQGSGGRHEQEVQGHASQQRETRSIGMRMQRRRARCMGRMVPPRG